MSANSELYVLVSFDMESDIGSWTHEHEGVIQGTGPILDVLARNDVKSTFLYTGDAALAGPKSVEMVKSAGHEIGCHTLHHESMGTPIFDVPGLTPVLAEEIYHRTVKATQVVEGRSRCTAGVLPGAARLGK